MTIKTQVVKLKVNKTMQKHLDALCDYRRYCWNKGLETWQLMYEAHSLNKQDNLSPNERRVRDELVANKADWQYDLSARCLQLAVRQLMYEAHSLNKQDNLSPNERRVRDELVANKADWQYDLSARCLQLAVKDLANAWKNFFDKLLKTWRMLGRTSLIRRSLIGEHLVLNQKRLPDKALKLTELRLLMASFALINQEASQKSFGLICLVMRP